MNSGYRGSPNLKKAGTTTEWTPEMVQDFIECSKDPVLFGNRHMKIVNKKEGLITIPLRGYQEEIIRSATNNRFTVAECSRQSGKALPLDTPIPSPDGWTTMGNLKTGDRLFDENGQIISVLSTSKTFVDHDCFRITFDDGSSVVADAEHLWTVKKSSHGDKDLINKTTQELFDSGVVYTDSRQKIVSLWKIPVAGIAQYNPQVVSIDPYTLGLWLGDGSAADGRLTSSHEDKLFYEKNIPYQFSHNHTKRDLFTGTIYGLSPLLRGYGLLGNKHIPREYLNNSHEVRIALLQGLMDSDGTVEKSGRLCIALSYNNYPGLIEDVYELLVSLGLKVIRKHYPKTSSTRLYFQCARENFDVFRLPRKLDKQNQTQTRYEYISHRYIRSIEKVESVHTRCIEVSSKSHLFLCSRHFIPTHNTTAMTVFILWYIIFNPYKTVGILANKEKTAVEILSRIQLAYQHLPKYMQVGIVDWNKGSFGLENGSRVFATSSSSDNIRGYSLDILLIDEAAHVDGWDEFFTSVFPTISSEDTTKLILVSTVNGLNHFYEITEGARKGTNDYHLISVPWQEVPGRDEAWKENMLRGMNNNMEKFLQEFENQYLGSSGTLINGYHLKRIKSEVHEPLTYIDNCKQYQLPIEGKKYCTVADVARGKGLDYSAFSVFDISQIPFVQVFTYRCNTITPLDYAEIIYRVSRTYNESTVLVEINDIGQQVVDSIFDDYDYENIIYTHSRGRAGKVAEFSLGKHTDRGIRTTKVVKSLGCTMLKLLIEQCKLVINDKDTANELATFSRKGDSYEAEEGKHDDMVMGLVLFAWLSDQKLFTDLNDISTLQNLKLRTEEDYQDEMMGFYVDNGQSIDEVIQPDSNWMFPHEVWDPEIEEHISIYQDFIGN